MPSSSFDVGSFAEPKLSMQHFRAWSNEIAAAYLRQGVAPTETLCKIAQSNELTPHQIEVLAGEANKVIHQVKYAAVEDKYHAADFPLASAKEALDRLKVTGEVKVAAVMPDPQPVHEVDPYKLFGVEPETMDKTASLKADFRDVHVRLSALKTKLAEKCAREKVAADETSHAFIKQARQLVLSSADDSAGRMQVLGHLDRFVKVAEMPEGRELLAKLAVVLTKEGLLKQAHGAAALTYFMDKSADCKAPPELISPDLPARVINGKHPLYITLKTYHDHAARMDHTRGRSAVVDDRLEILKEKMRAL